MSLGGRIIHTRAPRAVILIRVLVGSVFISEGVQKFLFPATLGVGRFEKVGIPSPELLAPVTAAFEIACGAMIILGLLTRVAALPLLAVICTAIYTTTVPMLAKDGFWPMAHEARADWSTLLSLLFLLVVGAGRWSIDELLSAPRMTGIP